MMEKIGNLYILHRHEQIRAQVLDLETGKWPIKTIRGPCLATVGTPTRTRQGYQLPVEIQGGTPKVGSVIIKGDTIEGRVFRIRRGT